MNNVETIPYDVHHIQVMDMRDEERAYLDGLGDGYERLVKAAEMSIEAGTFIYDGRILCCAGFMRLWPGVLEGWIIPSKWVSVAPIAFAKHMKRYIESVAKSFGCHRFQTSSNEGVVQERWMKFLGFEKEGTMKKYSYDKKDYHIYARLF